MMGIGWGIIHKGPRKTSASGQVLIWENERNVTEDV